MSLFSLRFGPTASSNSRRYTLNRRIWASLKSTKSHQKDRLEDQRSRFAWTLATIKATYWFRVGRSYSQHLRHVNKQIQTSYTCSTWSRVWAILDTASWQIRGRQPNLCKVEVHASNKTTSICHACTRRCLLRLTCSVILALTRIVAILDQSERDSKRQSTISHQSYQAVTSSAVAVKTRRGYQQTPSLTWHEGRKNFTRASWRTCNTKGTQRELTKH